MNTKFYFISALASMALLSGCSDNELASVETSQKTPIGFHTVGSQMGSRATIITPSNLKDTDFKVYAFTSNEDGSNGTLFMGNDDTELGYNGVEIKYNKGKWDYVNPTDLKYWPGTVTPLNFYAVNPSTFDVDLATHYGWQISKNTQQISYSCIDEYGANTGHENMDVMYAMAKKKTKNSNSGTVKLNFRHILSQIAFQAKTNDASIEVEINEIKLFNFNISGTFTLPTEDDTAPTKDNWETKPYTGGMCFSVIMGAKIEVKSSTDATNITNNKPMLVIPQTLKTWQTNTTTAKPKADADKDNESYLGIGCKIKVNGEYINGSATQTEYLYVPFGAEWQPGKRYVYTLIFGGGYTNQGVPVLSPINFEATAEDWLEDTNNNNDGNNVITQ